MPRYLKTTIYDTKESSISKYLLKIISYFLFCMKFEIIRFSEIRNIKTVAVILPKVKVPKLPASLMHRFVMLERKIDFFSVTLNFFFGIYRRNLMVWRTQS